VVLPRRSVVLGLVLIAGCSESLFGARGGSPPGQGNDAASNDAAGSDSGDAGNVPMSCPGTCIADAAGDFDGTARGKNNDWRYVEDHPSTRTWVPMTVGTNVMTGAVSGSRITTCATNPTIPACLSLPTALLVSPASSPTGVDPAIEFTAPANQVIQLSLNAFTASGTAQTIRLYRSSREDVLFTGTATAGTLLSHAITLDALAGDRFLVAVVPAGAGATDLALQLFVSAPPGTSFPAACQRVVSFDTMDGFGGFSDPCHGYRFSSLSDTTGPITPAAGTPPFSQLGMSVTIASGTSIENASTIDYGSDVTAQLWVNTALSGTSVAWPLSNRDVNIKGGVGIKLVPGTPPTIHAVAGDPQTSSFIDVSAPFTTSSWQFVRVVRARNNLSLCVQGRRVASAGISPEDRTVNVGVWLGKDTAGGSLGAFSGLIDDLRVMTGALPCDP